jgi:hypothetical protein
MANYHVNYITGSDVTGDGSTATPWGTILHACTQAAATTGDVIKVAGSDTTVLDAGATIAADRTDIFTTSTDLSGQIAVGDLIQMNPNIPGDAEFQDWMHAEVVSITASQIQTRFYFQIPNQENLTWTLSKYNDIIESPASETFPNNSFIGAIVEGGYNQAFTAIVGRTQFINQTVGVGSRSSTLFTVNTTGSGDWNVMPYWKNFSFSKYQTGIKTSFGTSIYANNLSMYAAQAGAATYNQVIAGLEVDAVEIYFLDCDGNMADRNAYIWTNGQRPAQSGSATYKYDAHIAVLRDRTVEVGYINFNGVTGITSKYVSYGDSAILRAPNTSTVEGPINIIALNKDDKGSSYAGTTALIYTGSAYVKPSSINIITNGDTEARANLTLQNDYAGINVQIVLPAGVTLDSIPQAAGAKAIPFNNAQVTLVEDGKIWNGGLTGSMMAANTTEQDTGDSCLEISRQRNALTNDPSINLLAAVPVSNGGLTLTSIDIRSKRIGASTMSPKLVMKLGSDAFAQVSGQMQNLNATTSYQTVNISIDPGYVARFDGMDMPLYLNLDNNTNNAQENGRLYIDSITPQYT